jgi:DNA replication protein DnaC
MPPDARHHRVHALGLYGLLAEWDALKDEAWVARLIEIEEAERARRSLERRLSASRIGRFKPMVDFDFEWPTRLDREQLTDLFTLTWLDEAANVVVVGPNGVGKTMIAKNLVHQAILQGASARILTASELLNDLAAQEGSRSLQHRLRHYSRPRLLAIDELGYLSYDARHADLLFEVVSRRYLQKSTLVTTNRPFSEWNETFPSASCVVSLIDRLIHRAEIVQIEGESYRLKEAKEHAARKTAERTARRRRPA